MLFPVLQLIGGVILSLGTANQMKSAVFSIVGSLVEDWI